VLYVATQTPDELFAFAISSVDGSLTPLPGSPIASPAATPTAIAIDPHSAFAIVAGSGAPSLAMFALDPTTGAPVALATAATNGFAGVTLAPSGQFAYAGDTHDTDYAFAIDRATGAATLVDSVPVQAGASFAVVDPAGRFLVTPGDNVSCGIAVSPIDPATGGLGTAAFYRPAACLLIAIRAAIDAGGTHLYVADEGNCTIYGYPIDPTTGAVSCAAPVAGSGPQEGRDCFFDVELHPSGRWMYAALGGVVVVGLDASTGAIGALAAPGPNTVADGSIFRLVLDPGGAFAYGISTNNARIYGYSIDVTSGALAPAPGSPYAAAGVAIDLAISNARFQ
jgi:6-phosphogluconolactonase (cycloisomerase 2 family)